MDSHRSDFSVLSVYRRHVHGAVIRGAARARRLATVAIEARGPEKRADPAHRLRYPHPALRRLFSHALPRSPAAHCRGVSVRISAYAVDINPRPHSVDCRTTRWLLRCHALRPGAGMRSRRMDDATLLACRIH